MFGIAWTRVHIMQGAKLSKRILDIYVLCRQQARWEAGYPFPSPPSCKGDTEAQLLMELGLTRSWGSENGRL